MITLSKSQKLTVARIILSGILLAVVSFLPLEGILRLPAFLIPYLVIGWDVLYSAVRNIIRGRVFDENFLMGLATIGALVIGQYPEAVFVMLFYKTGELFEDVAVARSRQSIADLMSIAPDTANILKGDEFVTISPDEVPVGSTILIRAGDRVPLDGVVIDGTSELDTSALTGESIPREVSSGDSVISGCINLSGVLRVKTEKTFGDSAVSRILELVENAAAKKAKAENFISVFARYYTPAVVFAALAAAFIPPLFFNGVWEEWIFRALIFLVVSCPCALVISIPLGFFGGIGAASRHGILIKGGNYLEALAKADTFVFDKTGTITTGTFSVVSADEEALYYSAHAGAESTHPLSVSIREKFGEVDRNRVRNIQEFGGRGISAEVDGHHVLSGNAKLMDENGISFEPAVSDSTTVYAAVDGRYIGCVVLEDTIKPEAKKAFSELRSIGIKKTVMLTGDRESAAKRVADAVGVSEFRSDLLPQDKVSAVEELISENRGRVVFVGDGINDAPVLARADIGVSMGALGSDAAIEAADIVLMDDSLARLPEAIRIAKKTRCIVIQNIVFALGIKFGVIILALFGVANMWEAIFADVGVAVIAILNSMRMLR
ncbi:MAG TPA: heavy metal translocating P-type ATPase, partial [Methanocorpusculum sp.]|nr:heavy metal translocating P-type ATPase [Methanocorpusculum sp.]